MIDREAAEVLGRFFPGVQSLRRVGDRHLGADSFVFSINEDDTSRSYYVRFSRTASREFECAEQIARLLSELNSTVSVPEHRLLRHDLICRSYADGFTLHDLQRYYIAGTETAILLNNTRSLPSAIRDQILFLLLSEPDSRSKFLEDITRTLSGWPSFRQWRTAVQRHLSATLAGEALRHPMAMMHAVQQSPVRERVAFSLDRQRFSQHFEDYLLSVTADTDVYDFKKTINIQLNDIVACCRRLQLYDIHFDNIVLSTNGRLCLIDLECSGIGSSDRLLSSPVLFLEDLCALRDSGGRSAPVWSEKGERLRHLPDSNDAPLIPLWGASRVILCGTETYSHIIGMLRETVFIVVAMERVPEFATDALDDDLVTFEPVWRDYQKLKRAARGMGFQPSNVDGEIWREYLSYCLEETAIGPESKNPFICRAQALLRRLRSFEIRPDSLEFDLFMRTWEFLRFLPFEIVVGRRVSRKELDSTIQRVVTSRIETRLDEIVLQTLTQVFHFMVPYHVISIQGIYRFPVGLRRRIERKISISERREMKRATVWLVSAISRVRPNEAGFGTS